MNESDLIVCASVMVPDMDGKGEWVSIWSPISAIQ